MPTWAWILIVVAVVVVLAGIALGWQQANRSKRLQDNFGPEYDRALDERGDRREAERELRARERRHDELELRPLDEETRVRYARAWRETQATFVDDPNGALTAADRLIGSVMRDRGYPLDDFEQRAADLSVEHPTVVDNYRRAHSVAVLGESGAADTEDQRQAFQRYRDLFAELVGSEERRV
jgi:predicted nucleic acid-binding protein